MPGSQAEQLVLLLQFVQLTDVFLQGRQSAAPVS